MFQFSGFAPFGDMSSTCRVTPFGNLHAQRLFAPHRSLSQLITSFIAVVSQGIRQLLLITYKDYFFYQYVKELYLVENIGVEPMTSCVQGRRSSQLS